MTHPLQTSALSFLFQIKFEIEDVSFGFLLLFGLRLWRILQITLLIKHIIGGAEHNELGAAVDLVADFLMFLALLLDELLGKLIALLEPRIFLGQFLANLLWSLLAISHRGKALLLDAVGYQIVDHRLGTALRQSLVVFGIALVVAMRTQLDGNVRILLEQSHQFVERLGAGWRQRSLVEIVEDVVDEHWGGDGSQRELEYILLAFLRRIHAQLLLVVEDPLQDAMIR